jgi:hypothetical protein
MDRIRIYVWAETIVSSGVTCVCLVCTGLFAYKASLSRSRSREPLKLSLRVLWSMQRLWFLRLKLNLQLTWFK